MEAKVDVKIDFEREQIEVKIFGPQEVLEEFLNELREAQVREEIIIEKIEIIDK